MKNRSVIAGGCSSGVGSWLQTDTLGSPSMLSFQLHLLAFPSLLSVPYLSNNKKPGSHNPVYLCVCMYVYI